MDAQTLRGPLGWSLVSIIAILLFCVYGALTIISPLLQQGATESVNAKISPLVEKYDHYVAVDIARFNGRSAFFKPIRIAPPEPPRREVVQTPDPEPVVTSPVIDSGPPPAPAIYTGPDLIAIIGEEAWFRGSGSGPEAVIRLKVGEEQDGLKLVKTTPPAMVSVEHRRGEYEIDLFSSEEPFFREDAPPVAQDSFLEEIEG